MINFQKPRRWVNQVFIHCTAADTNLRGPELYKWVWRIHVGGQPHRWSDVGYHYLIDKWGTLIPARPLEKVPAANPNWKKTPGLNGNAGTIAICLDGLDINKFTQEQFNTLKELSRAINKAYRGRITFHGHKEVAWKDCPVFDYKKVLRLSPNGRLGI